MEDLILTGFLIALALCAVVIVAQILASAFGAIDPSAAF
jgi:hypothetical protein